MRKRGFEVVEAYKDKGINLPVRKTKFSAGYDVEAAEDITIPVYEYGMKPTLVPTGIKAYCEADEYILLANRSSGPKKGFILANSVGIVDGDYYNNPDNEGHIFFAFFNFSGQPLEVKKGDAIGQALFHKFYTVDNDTSEGERAGGFGSTDNK